MRVGRRTAASPGSNSGVAHRGSNSGWRTEDVGPALPPGAPGLLGVLQPRGWLVQRSSGGGLQPHPTQGPGGRMAGHGRTGPKGWVSSRCSPPLCSGVSLFGVPSSRKTSRALVRVV